MNNEIVEMEEEDGPAKELNAGERETLVRKLIGEIKHLQNKEKKSYERDIENALALGERLEQLHEIYRYGNWRKEFKYQSYNKIIAKLGIESTTAHRYRCLYKLSLITSEFQTAKASATGIHNLKYLAMRHFSRNPVIRNASRTTMGWTPEEHDSIQKRIMERGFDSVAAYIRDLVKRDLEQFQSAVVIRQKTPNVPLLPTPEVELAEPYLIGM